MLSSSSLIFSLTALACLGALAGCAASIPVPANLQASGTELELSSSSKAFSQQVSFSAGQYVLLASAKQTEKSDSVRQGAVRTTKTTTWQVTFSESTQAVLSARCVDTFAWTQDEGTIFAEGVVDTFACEGQTTGGEKWTIDLHSGEDNGYVGTAVVAAQKYELRSLHEMAGSLKGASHGYAVYTTDDSATVAIRRVYSNQAGAIWLDENAKATPGIVASAIALLLYSPGK